MKRFALAALVLLTPAVAPAVAHAQADEQALVDRATLTVQELAGQPNGINVKNLIRQSRAVIICPRVFRAGFLLAGSGGGCVLAARDGSGSWSDPAFYTMGGASVGFQAGVQDSEVMFFILTGRGLGAVLDSQFKIGADANLTIATFGAGVEGATTAAVGADIVAFGRSRGLFGGVSIAGSLLSARTDWNQAYYGRPLAARQIVIEMQANNPGADPLRAMLMRFGAAPPAPPPAAYAPAPLPGQPAGYAPPPYAQPASAPPAPAPRGAVQAQPLPPPAR